MWLSQQRSWASDQQYAESMVSQLHSSAASCYKITV